MCNDKEFFKKSVKFVILTSKTLFLSERCKVLDLTGAFGILSMGMSNDYDQKYLPFVMKFGIYILGTKAE